MLEAGLPYKFTHQWAALASSGYVANPIPDFTASPGRASQQLGFPAVNAAPVAAGGIPPFIADFNGFGQYVTAWLQYMQAGAAIPWDAAFSAAVGGYPLGAVVLSATVPDRYWRSTVDANTTNPDTGGAGWINAEAFTSNIAGFAQRFRSGFILQLVGVGAVGGGLDTFVTVSVALPIPFQSAFIMPFATWSGVTPPSPGAISASVIDLAHVGVTINAPVSGEPYGVNVLAFGI